MLWNNPTAKFSTHVQELHAHSLDSHDLAARMDELQSAHATQSTRLQQLQALNAKVPLLRSTVQKQEQVICALEVRLYTPLLLPCNFSASWRHASQAHT